MFAPAPKASKRSLPTPSPDSVTCPRRSPRIDRVRSEPMPTPPLLPSYRAGSPPEGRAVESSENGDDSSDEDELFKSREFTVPPEFAGYSLKPEPSSSTLLDALPILERPQHLAAPISPTSGSRSLTPDGRSKLGAIAPQLEVRRRSSSGLRFFQDALRLGSHRSQAA